MKTSSSNKNSLLIRQFFGALLACGIVGYILVNAIFFPKEADTYLDCLRDATNTRNILHSTVWAEPLWGIRANIENSSYFGTYVVSYDNLLILSNSECNGVDTYNLLTGKRVWTEFINGSTLWVDEPRQRLYAVSLGSTQRRLWALDITNGNRLWRNNEFDNQRISLRPHIDLEGNIYFYVAGGGGIRDAYLLDAETGKFEDELDLPSETLFYEDGLRLEASYREIRAYDVNSDTKRWTWKDGDWSAQVTNLQVKEGILLVDALGGVTALNFTTGRVLWKSSSGPTSSNVWVANGIVYFLDYQARLVMLELQTGNVVGVIEFERPKESNLLTGSYVTASGNVVAIYFQDTRKLSVFDWSP